MNSLATELQRGTEKTFFFAGFDVGIAVTATELNEDNLWKRAASGGSAPKTLYVPRLYAHKGLPFGIDIGAFYSELPSDDLTLWGAEVRYAIWEGGVAAPALGIRVATTQLSGLPQFEISTLGIDIGISKGFTLLTVYGGAGTQYVESEVNLNSFNSEDFFQKHLYAGQTGFNEIRATSSQYEHISQRRNHGHRHTGLFRMWQTNPFP